ncbi:hypothetical protein V8C35DRAFT_84860 [Trichoderma chlorosporum]
MDNRQLEQYGYRKSTIVDHTLDDARLESRCPLDNGRHHGESKHLVGKLDLLPLELITKILLTLDIPSLTAFRQINRRAMSLVDSLRQYRAIFDHCPNVLRAIVSIDAKHFDCTTLFDTLSTTKCATCDNFGCYLYLITCKRVCYSCFTTNALYFPVSLALATKHTGLARRELKCLPHISSLPGRYTAREKGARGRIILLDRQSLSDRASEVSMRALAERAEQRDLTAGEVRRYMSIISAPYFGSSGSLADWGFYCVNCIDSTDPKPIFRIKYTGDGFRAHMTQYGINHGRNL